MVVRDLFIREQVSFCERVKCDMVLCVKFFLIFMESRDFMALGGGGSSFMEGVVFGQVIDGLRDISANISSGGPCRGGVEGLLVWDVEPGLATSWY